MYTKTCYKLICKQKVNRKYLKEKIIEKIMRVIISNSCFDNNTFKQNTMEIRDEKEDSVKNVKTLPM